MKGKMVVAENKSITRLLELTQKIKNRQSTSVERDEYMRLLLSNNSITQAQYNDYQNGKNVEALLEAALTIGGIFLLGYMISSLVKK